MNDNPLAKKQADLVKGQQLARVGDSDGNLFVLQNSEAHQIPLTPRHE